MNAKRNACGLFLLLTVAASSQTMHDDDKGGTNQTVTIYTKSRTHLDEGLMSAAKGTPVLVGDRQVWQHGHPGPRILRVILPGREHHGKTVTGFQLEEHDTVEISLVNPNKAGASLGVLTLSRNQKSDGSGTFTSGHAELAGIPSLLPCVPTCPACERQYNRENNCESLKTRMDAAIAGDSSNFVWVFEVKNADLKWVPKSPTSVESIRQIVAAVLPTPIRFDFALENAGKREDVAMKELHVMRDQHSVWSTPMPKYSRFQVCAGDEKTNKPLCDPLPECKSFWKRHFNHGCRVYGGTGVLRDYDPKKHKSHH